MLKLQRSVKWGYIFITQAQKKRNLIKKLRGQDKNPTGQRRDRKKTKTPNRNKKIHLFTCKNCGYKSNDDRIGAMNLYRMGINYLEDSQVPDTVTAE